MDDASTSIGLGATPPRLPRVSAALEDRLIASPETWTPGFQVPGTRYVVRREIGRGGMGIVFEVRKEPAGIAGAMKVMLRPRVGRGSDRELAERFVEEGRMLAGLRHRNLVEVRDCDYLPDGTPFLVMELLDGRTLREAMRADVARPVARNILDVASQLCDGLHELHSRKLVHRDVKPENVFLHRVGPGRPDVVVKLLDFGLAGPSGQWSRFVVGTPRYMAPEQLRGRPITDRSDQYAVALIVYELMAGRPPWDIDVNDSDAMIAAQLEAEPPPPSRFCPWASRHVDEVVQRALAKEPKKRWSSVDQFVRGLQELNEVRDGSAFADLDINTTARSLATMASPADSGSQSPDFEPFFHSTEQRMEVPPLEGNVELVSLQLFESLREGGADDPALGTERPEPAILTDRRFAEAREPATGGSAERDGGARHEVEETLRPLLSEALTTSPTPPSDAVRTLPRPESALAGVPERLASGQGLVRRELLGGGVLRAAAACLAFAALATALLILRRAMPSMTAADAQQVHLPGVLLRTAAEVSTARTLGGVAEQVSALSVPLAEEAHAAGESSGAAPPLAVASSPANTAASSVAVAPRAPPASKASPKKKRVEQVATTRAAPVASVVAPAASTGAPDPLDEFRRW